MSANAHWAWALASEIEWACARDRARSQRSSRQGARYRSLREQTAAEYDPHAATELALLIELRALQAQREAA